MKNFRLTGFFIFLQIFGYITSYGADTTNLHRVKVQFKWKHQFQFAGYYAAIEKGFYKEVGLNVELLQAPDGKEPAQIVLSGNAEFGTSTSDILLMRAANKPVVILASIFQHSPQVIVASQKSGIENVHNLFGKKLMIEHYAADVMAYLKDEGITPDKFTLVEHSFNVKSLINSEVDAMTAYITDEPYELLQSKFEYVILSPVSGGIDFYGDVLFTTEQMINEHPEIVKKMLHATIKGWHYAMRNSDEIIEIILEKYSKRHSKEHLQFEALKMKELIMPEVVEIGYSNPGRWENIATVYKKTKMIPADFSISGLLYSDYVKKETEFPWKTLFIFLPILILVASVAYFFFRLSRKLTSEIRKREKVQFDLVKSQTRYKKIIEELPSPALIVNIQTREILYSNRYFDKIMFYEKRKLKSKMLFKFYNNPNDEDYLFERLKDSKTISNYEIQLVNMKGYAFWVNLSGSEINYDDQLSIIFVFTDITSSKLAEEQIQKSRDYFQFLANSIPSFYAHIDLTGNYIFANKILKQWFQLNPENLIRQNFFATLPAFVNSENRTILQNAFEEVFKGKKITVNIDFNSSNQRFYTLWQCIPHYTKDEVTSISIIATDISELKTKEEELSKLNATKDRFFSIIAHDLRGPLGSIYSSLQILINPEYELSIEKRSFLLNELAISSSNIFDLLENLLVWANNQRGKMKVERKPCYLYEAVGESIAVFSQMAINKNINLINDVSPNQFVFADENSLNVILRNLISNAIKFSNQYTSVIVRFEKKDGRMLIWVIDQGIGMTKELLENLFRIDKKVSEAGTSGETGTGLGLILCKEFVHLNHGELFVESEPGKGSKFCISLPENES